MGSSGVQSEPRPPAWSQGGSHRLREQNGRQQGSADPDWSCVVSQSPSPQNTEEDRCLYCGPKGHFIDSCPMRPKQHDLSVMVRLLTGENNKSSSPAKVSNTTMLSKKSGRIGPPVCLDRPQTPRLLPICKKTKHQVFSFIHSLTDLTLRTSSLTCSLMFDHPDSLLCNWITCREIESVIHMNMNLETVIVSSLRSRLSPV